MRNAMRDVRRFLSLGRFFFKTGVNVLACLIFIAAVPCFAEQCPDCRSKAHTKDIGSCKLCGGMTQSGQFQLCMACSSKLGECEWCRKPLAKAKQGQLNVRMMVLAEDRGKPVQEEWIRKELKALGAREGTGVTREWFALGSDVVGIHDSRHYGQSAVLLRDTGTEKFTVEVSGSDPSSVELDRAAGTRRVVRQTLGSSFGNLVLYLVFEVQGDKSSVKP